ncbi:MAG: DNA internalization-related competence protein ComEC/Rec2 [Candidatus Margulisiibacteriota bacterium]
MSLTPRPVVAITTFYVLAILFFSFVSSLFPDKGETGQKEVPVRICGAVDSEPGNFGTYTGFDLKEDRTGKSFKVMIFSGGKGYEYGDRIELKGSLMEARKPGNPYEMDYDSYLREKGFAGSISVFPDKDGYPKVIAKNKGNLFISLSLAVKNKVMLLHKGAMPEPYSSLFGGILFGMKGSPVPDEVKSRYQKAGVVHILVASGQQVSILIGVSLLVLGAIRLPMPAAFIITSFITWSFAAMAGFGASITRSAIMGQLMIVGKAFDREGDFLNSLCLAAFILLMIDPNNLFDIGFQLSFLATWSLVYVVPIINEKLAQRLPGFLSGPVSVACAPILATSPITAYNFSQLNPVAFLSNLLVVPAAELLTVLGFASTAAGLVLPHLGNFLDGAVFAIMFLLDLAVSLFASLPMSNYFIARPHFGWMIGYYICFLFLLKKAKDGQLRNVFINNKYVLVLSACLLFALLSFQALVLGGNELSVSFIDVGQGDSILIEAPDGQKVLIDGGGKRSFNGQEDKIGSRIVVPFLHNRGINKLDLVVLTHPHDDHVGGLVSVLKEIKTDKVIDPGFVYDSPAYENFLELIKRNKIKYATVKAGDIISIGAVKGYVLSPPESFLKGTESDANNSSIVIRLVYGGTSFMLTGDAAFEAEKEMLDRGYYFMSDVLKIGHHGSATSTSDEFLEAAAPKTAVICVGKGNKFGHPRPEVLEKLKQRGIKVYRTDEDGSVSMTSDGSRITIKAFRKN